MPPYVTLMVIASDVGVIWTDGVLFSALQVRSLAPLCADLVGRAALAAGDEMHWSYDGAIGLDFWGELDASYAACGAGTQQSPIDVSGAVSAKFDAGSIKWKPIKLGSIVNNGHTIQVKIGRASCRERV